MQFTKYLRRPLVVGIFAMSLNQAIAAESLNVFEAPSSNEDAIGEIPSGKVVGRVKYNSSIRDSISVQSTLILNLDFLNESTELNVVSVNANNSSVAYSATSPNSADIFTIAQSNGAILGSFSYNDKLYKFRPAGNGDTLIIEMPEEQLFENALGPIVATSRSAEVLEGMSTDAVIEGTDDGSVIDLIVTYTDKFVEDVGGAGNIAAYMAQLEHETNLSFMLSDVNTRVDIVHAYQTEYSDSTNFKKDADYFLNGLGSGQELRTLRNEHFADIMIVLTGNLGYDACGYSAGFKVDALDLDVNGDYAGMALSIIREGCGTGYYQFAHEIGHIFGADHNIEEASGLGADYAHGYCGNEWRSIMAFGCPGGSRLSLWSNPYKTFNGEAMGVAGVSNNVKVLNDRALEVSNFRFRIAPPPQIGLTSPVGTIVIDTTPQYEWEHTESAASYNLRVTDNSGNVLLEKLYTATDAGCVSGTCSVTPTKELPFGIINWLIIPENSTGKGPVSETGIFTVAPVPIVPDAVTLVTPEGVVPDSTPTYKWNAVSISSWYKLLVIDGSGDPILNKWYKAVNANCQSGSGECSVTPDIAITQNPVEWKIQTWNSAGYGEWSESNVFQVFPLQ